MTSCLQAGHADDWRTFNFVNWGAVHAFLRRAADVLYQTPRPVRLNTIEERSAWAVIVVTSLEMLYGPNLHSNASYHGARDRAEGVQEQEAFVDESRILALISTIIDGQQTGECGLTGQGTLPWDCPASGLKGWWLTKLYSELGTGPSTDHFLTYSALAWHCLRRNSAALAALTDQPIALEPHFLDPNRDAPTVIADMNDVLQALFDARAISSGNYTVRSQPFPEPAAVRFKSNFWGELIGYVGLLQSTAGSAAEYIKEFKEEYPDVDVPNDLVFPALDSSFGIGLFLESAFKIWRRRAIPLGSGTVYASSTTRRLLTAWAGRETSPFTTEVTGAFNLAVLPTGPDPTAEPGYSDSDLPQDGTYVDPGDIPQDGTFVDRADVGPTWDRGTEAWSPWLQLLPVLLNPPSAEPAWASPEAGQDWDASLHQLPRAVSTMFHAGHHFTRSEKHLIVNRLWAWRQPTCSAYSAQPGECSPPKSPLDWPETALVPAEPAWVSVDPLTDDWSLVGQKTCNAPSDSGRPPIPAISLSELLAATTALIQARCHLGETRERTLEILRDILRVVAARYRERLVSNSPLHVFSIAGWHDEDPSWAGDHVRVSDSGGTNPETNSVDGTFAALMILRICRGVVPDFGDVFLRVPFVDAATSASLGGLADYLHILSSGRVGDVAARTEWNDAHPYLWPEGNP